MPNAAAHFDDDFDIAPTRKKASRGSRKSSAAKPAAGRRMKKGKSRFGLNVDMHRVARYGAIGMSATVAIGIMVNALMMQKGHHPAPLFGKSISLGQGTAPPPMKAAPSTAATTAKKTAVAPAPIERAQPRPEAPAERDADTAPVSNDAIGRLLQGGPATAERPNTKTVLGVQRALTKVGIAVKQTGTFGPQTKKAIEHFEKDHHLPVKGEMSRRVLKLLASTSGIKIEH